jgi:hypothetical protein
MSRRPNSLPAVGLRAFRFIKGEPSMTRHMILALACAGALVWLAEGRPSQAQQPQGQSAYPSQAYGQQWGKTYSTPDWNRFYHYPYVYYPQNYWNKDYYRSSDSLYYRYPAEMRIPVYNTRWHNYYPEGQLWHSGHHFILDVF